MRKQQMHIAMGSVITLLAMLALLSGCGKINGSYTGNQPPNVEIVNVPQNAADSTLTQQTGMAFQAAQLNKPVALLSMQGTAMVPGSQKVYGADPNAPFIVGVDYYMAYDTSWVDTLQGGQIVNRSAQGALVELAGGSMHADSSYFIDFQFNIVNFYVFSYAPTLHWVGYDADGFVDHYRFGDVTDTAFISAFKLAEDNGTQFAYIQAHSSQIYWVDTTAMQARVYLLTTSGDTTEHLFLVRAVDNLGIESQVDYKTFYRSNNAPNNPLIKQVAAPDSAFSQHAVVVDTLFSLDAITPNWAGVSFNWHSTDPDDKSLYQIPLTYTHYLVKTPGDTVWAWSDSSWTDVKQVQMTGLETGSYVLSAWCRDDAYTLCAQPATISFTVVKPTFQHHILVVDETTDTGPFEINLTSANNLNIFWNDLLTSLQGQLDNDNYVMDGVDVYFKDNSVTNNLVASPIPYTLIGQYKLVLIYHDSHAAIAIPEYVTHRNEVLADYLDAGGRVWIEGRNVLNGAFKIGPTAPLNAIPIPSTTFLGKYMQLVNGYPEKFTDAVHPPDFVGANPVLEGFQPVTVDSTKVNQLTIIPQLPPFYYPNHAALLETDWFTRTDQAITLYTYVSSTTDTTLTPPTVLNEDSHVADGATPVHCTVQPLNAMVTQVPPHPVAYPVLAVYRVYNQTKGVMGEIESFDPYSIQVAYPFGQPWSDSDVLQVDYLYDPTSQNQLKPVAMRYEQQPRVLHTVLINGFLVSYYSSELGYRTSMFTFPLYYMKNDQGQVTQIAREMLNWFFYPGMHGNAQ
jgi:hypothetical protein